VRGAARHALFAGLMTMAKPHLRPKAAAFGLNPHRGASYTDRAVAEWQPMLGSADSDLLFDRDALTARARDLDRNNGVAAGGVRTILDNVIGTGLRLIPKPDWRALGKTEEWANEWAREARAYWDSYYWTTACHAGDTLTGDQLTRQGMRSVISAGEGLALPLWIPKRSDGFATKLQMVDPDRLSPPNGSGLAFALTPGTRGGIEFDQFGAPVAYNIRNSHPADAMLGVSADSFQWTRVPRRMPNGRLRVLHFFDSERSGQSRGKTLFSSILPQFKQIDRYVEAELMRAVVNSMIAGTITTPMQQEQIVELFGNDPVKYAQARNEHRIRIEAGTFVPLFPGDKLEPMIPAGPTTAFPAFVDNIYRIMACGLDIPHILLMKDFSKSSYSSARAAMLEAWRAFNRWRDWLGTMFLDPWYGLFVEELANDGRIEAPDFYANRYAYTRCRWIGPGRGMIDATKETDAAVTRMANNLSTLEEECAEQGRDWREVVDQRAVESEYLKSKGLSPTVATAPAAPMPAVADPNAAPADPYADPNQTEDPNPDTTSGDATNPADAPADAVAA
jgi:lambda family phage portal protein